MRMKKRASKSRKIGKAAKLLTESIPDHFHDFQEIMRQLKQIGVCDVKVIHVMCPKCQQAIQTDYIAIENAAKPSRKKPKKSP